METAFTSENVLAQARNILDERALRLLAACFARALGHGGVQKMARLSGLSRRTLSTAKRELAALPAKPAGRPSGVGVRRKGSGPKIDPELRAAQKAALNELIEPHVRGDPMSPLRWTTKSLRKLSEEMAANGFAVSHETVRTLLLEEGYTMQSCKRSHEGGDEPDRDLQFEHIAKTTAAFQEAACPVISVDSKKKERIGNFKNDGREWHPKGEGPKTEVYEFTHGVEKAAPYGVYDIGENQGYVNVGTSHDTARFAVDSIRRWWECMGRQVHEGAKALYITADGGGSNGSRSRLWKVALQEFADETGLNICVSHFPPGTSKWNKIEHRLFSQISLNWRGRPLETLETIVSLIGSTRTKTGLTVTAESSKKKYAVGEDVRREFAKLHILRHDFHPEWNYLIRPRKG